MRWKEVALGNLTKDRSLVMRGQGWPLEEEDKGRGSNLGLWGEERKCEQGTAGAQPLW